MRKIWGTATISILILCGSAFAAIDEKLVGAWGLEGMGVGVSGGKGDVFVLRLGADGGAVVETVNGCTKIDRDAVWEADGAILRLTFKDVHGDRDQNSLYEYSIEGDKLFLRLRSEMVLTRRK